MVALENMRSRFNSAAGLQSPGCSSPAGITNSAPPALPEDGGPGADAIRRGEVGRC